MGGHCGGVRSAHPSSLEHVSGGSVNIGHRFCHASCYDSAVIARDARDSQAWDGLLARQQFRPFLQSWTMGEVYRDIGQDPVRLAVFDGDQITAICFGHIIHARRGRHLSVPYGPVIDRALAPENAQHALRELISALKDVAMQHRCTFIRLSPFWPAAETTKYKLQVTTSSARPAPLHLLAEDVWYLPLTEPDAWQSAVDGRQSAVRKEEEIFSGMRATTRNLVRRSEREGIEVAASLDPNRDIDTFLALHEETRKRHRFTPYTDVFFRAQIRHFSAVGSCTLYLARHQGQTIAASIHMHCFGETSYHHGASLPTKLPVSTALQWRAIRDALQRGDRVYNFWGIAPLSSIVADRRKAHPFAGVTLFKTGFGGGLLPLIHCIDLPLSPRYALTYVIETLRKWRRGF